MGSKNNNKNNNNNKKKKKGKSIGDKNTTTTTKDGLSSCSSSSSALIWVDPGRVRFQHSRIRPVFSGCGRTVLDTLEEIRQEKLHPANLPPIQVIVGPMDKQDGLPWYFSLNNRRLWVLKRCREEGLLLGNDKNKIQVRVRQYKSATERNRYTLENCVLEATFLKESTLTTTTATTTITTHNQSPPPQSRNESQQEDEQQQQQGKCVGLSSSSSSSSTEGKGIKDMDNHTSLKSFMEESKLVERGNSCNLEDSQTTTLTTTTTMDGTTMETKSGQLVRIVEQPPLPEPDNLLLTAKDDVDDSSSSCSDSDSLFSGARRQNPFCVLD